jgi:phosphatidylserine/phosphatidylglycerophosphate/cardiolipin synthase-like enzyme
MVHARCNDGSESPSIGIQGTCSHHGGVHREIEPSSPGTVDVLGPLIIFLIGAVVVAVGAVTHRLTGVKMEQKVPVLASGSPRSGRRWSDWAYGVAKFSIPALSVLFLSYAWFTAGVDKPAQTPVAVPSGASEPAQTPGAFACGASEPAQTPRGVVRGAAVSTCFTPRQPCEDSIVTKINEGRSEIRVQAYGFTSPPILSALASAKERGLDVAVILDKINDRFGKKSRYSGATFVAHAGIPVLIDDQPAIAHNKIIVIDHHLLITGSYNFTRHAKRNAENVTFTDSAELASQFLSNWNARCAVSRAYADYRQ